MKARDFIFLLLFGAGFFGIGYSFSSASFEHGVEYGIGMTTAYFSKVLAADATPVMREGYENYISEVTARNGTPGYGLMLNLSRRK